MRVLIEYGRGEGAVCLALLDHRVDPRLVLVRARVRQYASIPQSAGPELGSALHPTDHFAFGQQPGGFKRGVVKLLDGGKAMPSSQQRVEFVSIRYATSRVHVRHP